MLQNSDTPAQQSPNEKRWSKNMLAVNGFAVLHCNCIAFPNANWHVTAAQVSEGLPWQADRERKRSSSDRGWQRWYTHCIVVLSQEMIQRVITGVELNGAINMSLHDNHIYQSTLHNTRQNNHNTICIGYYCMDQMWIFCTNQEGSVDIHRLWTCLVSC